MTTSELERKFRDAWQSFGDRSHGDPVSEYEFAEAGRRKYRFDFAWPTLRVAVEVDGDVHRTRERFRSDCDKLNMAVGLGWRVLRFQYRHLARRVPVVEGSVPVAELDHDRKKAMRLLTLVLDRATKEAHP